MDSHAHAPGASLASGADVMRRAAGFSLLEVLVVLAVLGVLSAMAVPTFNEGMRRQRLGAAVRQVSQQVSTARLQAVNKNRRMQVRLNCPAPNEFRVVEITGVAAIDTDSDRCSDAVYPFPDLDPAVRPDLDGPTLVLPAGVRFGAVQALEIAPRGTVTALTGALPAFIEVTDGVDTRRVRVTAAGQLQIQ
jgi:prepilin-type N-terminal cleavage/methylation domain-containing protein